MKKPRPIIGILAGMGPKSTAPFLDLVIEQCQKQYGAKNDSDFPHIIIYSLPTPFFVNKKIDDKKMKQAIQTGLQKLESTGVDLIAMPCNTAHRYFDFLKDSIRVPLLNIVDTTVTKLSKRSKKGAILATRATIEANIYQSRLLRNNFELAFKEQWQKEVDRLIQGVKKCDKEEKLVQMVKKLEQSLKKEKVDTVIIACTDITKVLKKMKGFVMIDSSEALAEETIKKYLR